MCTAFLDLRKAFDSLDHSILLRRLSELGVHGTELSWFINYLSDRLQRVKLNGKVSGWSTVKGGIPQGSALGPLLFLVYVNAMPSVVEYGKLLQFADETTLICSGPDVDTVKEQLSHDLSLLSSWISAFSKMRLNIGISSVMWFTPKNVSGSAIFVDDNQLWEVDQQRYSGIIFDKRLQWNSQVSDICKRVAYYLHLLSVHRKSLTFSVLKLLTESLIFSRLTYALIGCVGSTFTE